MIGVWSNDKSGFWGKCIDNLVQLWYHANSEEYYVWVWLIVSRDSKLEHDKSGLVQKDYHALLRFLIVHEKSEGASWHNTWKW